MRGSIRKRGTSYQIRINLGVDPLTSKRKEICKSGYKTKKESERALNELINSLENGTYVENSKLILKDILSTWLDTVKSSVEQSTYEFYKDIAERILIPELGGTLINKLIPIQLQKFINKYINEKGLSPTTVRHYYNTLNICLNYAKKLALIQYNPCSNIEAPKPCKAKIAVLDIQQVNTLLNYTKDSEFKFMYIPLLIAITCGMRRGEILGLTWDNVDLNNGVIRIVSSRVKTNTQVIVTTPKTDNSIRNIDLLPSTIPILKEWRKQQKAYKLMYGLDYIESNYLCTWDDGRLLRPDYLTQTLTKLLNKCNLPHLRFHDLRHTHASLMLLNNTNPKIVAERLGHREVSMTLDTYSHLLPSMQKGAAEELDKKLFDAL